MSKRKNELKNKINNCYLCGVEFISLKEKHGHRINPKKGNLENNLVILCANCKKYLQNNKEVKVYNISICKEIRDKYFSNIPNKNKQILLSKIREFRLRNSESVKS